MISTVRSGPGGVRRHSYKERHVQFFPVQRDALVLVPSFSVAFLLGNATAQSSRPYAGKQARAIKALSTEQIADLKAGRGMSLHLPLS